MAKARGPLLSRQDDVLQIFEREGVCTILQCHSSRILARLQALAKVTTATTLRANKLRTRIDTDKVGSLSFCSLGITSGRELKSYGITNKVGCVA